MLGVTATKSTFFTKYTEEATIEVNASLQDTIDRLVQQEGVCRERFCNKGQLFFTCSEKGDISLNAGGSLYVIGKVLCENGKTVVKIYSVRSKAYLINHFVSIGLELLLLAAYLAVKLRYGEPVDIKEIILLLLIIISVPFFCFSLKKRNESKEADTEKMVLEITRRVEAIERWDD